MIDFSCNTLSEMTYAVLYLNRYSFRYTAPEHSSEVSVLPWSTTAALRLYEMSKEYYYEISAIDLVTGSIHPYRELPARRTATSPDREHPQAAALSLLPVHPPAPPALPGPRLAGPTSGSARA